jgi:hypothetical protein
MIDLLKIQPTFPSFDFPAFESLFDSTQQLVKDVIVKCFPLDATHTHPKDFWNRFDSQLPIVNWTVQRKTPTIISIVLICKSNAHFSNGAGRFLLDTINRFALPGQFLGIQFARFFDFVFSEHPGNEYGISEIGLKVSTEEEFEQIKKNVGELIKEVQLIVHTVYEIRRITAIKSLSEQEKILLLQEQMTSLVERPSKEFEFTIFEHLQHLKYSLSAEEKWIHLKKQIDLTRKKPQFFDRDIFQEIQDFSTLCRRQFIAKRELKHIAKIICFQYFFKKMLVHMVASHPFKRHFYIKFLKTNLSSGLGIVLALNLFNDHELFEMRHILEGIKNFINDIELIPGSYIVDRRMGKMLFFYLEIEKKNRTAFSFSELKNLKKGLLQEFKERIEKVIHPLLIFRNEEEILKYAVALERELSEIDDLPQAVIIFDKQTQHELLFNVIWLRFLKQGSFSLKEIFSNDNFLSVKYERTEVIGCLKNEFPKELNIFTIFLPKTSFFRKDCSLNLSKAREWIVLKLKELLGDFRDYNGAMMTEQNRAFEQFKSSISGNQDSLLMDYFFYNIEPRIQQTILQPALISRGFLLLCDAFKENLTKDHYSLRFHQEENACIFSIASFCAEFKRIIFKAIDSQPKFKEHLTLSSFTTQEMDCLSLFYLHHDVKAQQCFHDLILTSLHWNRSEGCWNCG